MKNEIKIFLTALQFFTRICVSKNIGFSIDMLNKSTRYFPLIGGIVGGIGALILYFGEKIFPLNISILLSMVATIVITGAFHEDGFADFCDGYGGGGLSKEKILAIMKDSRIGTYGAIGLLFILLVKFFSLASIDAVSLPVIIIAGHIFSRFPPVVLIFSARYIRDDGSSKTKPVGNNISLPSFIIAAVFGILSFVFIPYKAVLFITVIISIVFVFFRYYVIRKTGGYTGDVLGALQQLTEVCFYLSIILADKIDVWTSF